MMLEVVIFLCSMQVQDCNASTASTRYTLLVEANTPMGCFREGYQELAKMASFDPATQKAVLSCGRHH